MKVKKLLSILLLIISILSINIVKAGEEEKELYKQFSTPEVSTYYNYLNTIRTAFYKDGIVVYTRNVVNGDNLVYYDFNGKLISSINTLDLTDDKNMIILYMEAKDEYLYMLSNEGIYKLNSNLEEIASNHNAKIDIYNTTNNNSSNYYGFEAKNKFYTWSRLDNGIKQMEFTDEGIYLPNKLFIDYNLSELTTLEESNKYIHYIDDDGLPSGKGAYEIDELKSSCGLEMPFEYGIYNKIGWSCDKLNEYTVVSGPIDGDNVIAIYKNNKEIWKIENKEYKFLHTKFYNDIIITIAMKYNDDLNNYKSDLLFYDLEGNYLGKIEKNEKLYYLTVYEDKFAFGREIIDGICTKDKYYMNDSGCDSITNFEVYTLGTSKVNPPEDGESSGINITNPETSSSKIMYIFIILLGSLSIGLLIRKKTIK